MGFGINLQKPLWDPSNFTYNSFACGNTFGGFQTPIWSAASGNSAKSSDNESYEDWKKRTSAEYEKKEAEKEFFKEKDQEISKTRELIEIQNKKIEGIKKGKKSDGSAVVDAAKLQDAKFKSDGTIDKEAMKPQKKGFWQKCGQWAASAGAALKNMGKAFIGMDKDGNINPLKLIKNVAITVGAVAACFIPVVGPVIGYGLLAYGVGSGAVGVYKGVKKLDNATSEEEREQARQDICSGAFVGAASAVGLRGLGKSLGTAANASRTAATSTLGKISQGTAQFAKDMTINAVKATGQAIKADATLIAAKGGGVSGFFKAWGGKTSAAWESVNNWQKRYDTKYTQMETSLNNKLSSIDAQIQEIRNLGTTRNLTPVESQKLALLKEEQMLLRQNLTELQTNFRTTGNKDIYDRLAKTNSATKTETRIANRSASSNPNRIQGKNIPEADVTSFNNRVLADQRAYAKELSELVKFKANTMRQFAKHADKHTTELSQYVPTRDANKTWWKPSTWRKNEYQLAIGGKNPGRYTELAGIALTSQASPAYLSYAQWTRDYSVSMFGDLIELTPEQTEEYLNQLEQEKKELENALKAISDIEDSTKWNQLKSQAKAQQEAAAKAQQEAAAQQGN